MANTNRQKHAVILSGGVAYGAFAVGVMKALFSGQCATTNYQPIDGDIFTGTSVGAVNAAFMVSQPGRSSVETIADLEHFWLHEVVDDPRRYGNGVFRFRYDLLDFFKIQGLITNPIQPFTQLLEDSMFLAQDFFARAVDFIRSSEETLEDRMLDLFNLSSLISVEPLRQLLNEHISLGSIRRSDKILRIIATNWETGGVNIFDNEDLTDEDGVAIIMASTALPGFFPTIDIKGKPAVDGGVVMNVPMRPAIRAGADVLHVIYLDPDVKTIPIERLQSVFDAFYRMLTIQFAIKINEDIETVNWINQGLEVIERVRRDDIVSDGDLRDFIRVAGRIERRIREGSPYKKVTVHRYRLREDLGGITGFFNFSRKRIADLIDLGFNLACQYDPVTQSLIPQ